MIERAGNGQRGAPPRWARYVATIMPRSSRVSLLVGLFSLAVISRHASSQPHTPARVTSAPVRVAPGDFPHAKHAKLFPTCEGCHADVTGSTTGALFPDAASCTTCHNGTDAKRVQWTPPARPAPPGLLAFSHGSHFTKADSATRQCVACHAATTGNRFMDVEPARSATCFGCHTHRTAAHYDAPNTCSTCHIPVTRASSMGVAALRNLPRPASHDQPGFVLGHAPAASGAGSIAQCATCHARESCARCHMNAAALRDVAALASDARFAEVTRGLAPTYPVPASHRAEDFAASHGPAALAPAATCANCHARSSCTTCHTGAGGAKAIRALPEPTRGPRGVQLRRDPRATTFRQVALTTADTTTRRVRPHPTAFIEGHRTVAASNPRTCEGCHTQRFCSDCHAGESRRAFHPANFAARHAAPTYARDRECASCHNTEVFCRDCHRASGLQAGGRNAAVYHNAQPQWLLQHGRAARLELATCTSCHTQATCMRCHATTGWGVNPHGADFDASALGRKAMAMCARCHIRDPRR